MKDEDKTREQLINELAELRRRIAELEAAEAERKRAEEALRESEGKYRSLVEESVDGIAIVHGGEIKFVNWALVEMFGCQSEDEIVGRTFTDFVSPEYRNLMVQRGRTREKGEDVPGRYEFKALCKDGTEFDAEISVSAIAYEGGVARQGIIRDITERKQAEEALQDAEARYRTLVEQLPAIIYIVEFGKVSRAIYISPQVESLLGFSQAEWLADPDLWIKQLYPDDREHVLSEVRRKDASGEPLSLEYRVLARDGRVLWFRNQTILVRDETGQILYSHGVMFDITERRRAEEALWESEQEKALILDSVSEVINYNDTDCRIKWVNRAGVDLANAKPDDLIGRHCHEIWAGRSEPCEGCPVVEAMGTGEPQQGEMTTPDGRVWFIRGAPIRDEDGEVIGAVEVTLEITERKRAEQLLRALNEAALAMEQALTPEEIFAAVAEEFKKLDFSCLVLFTDESQTRLFPKYLSYEARMLKAAEKLAGIRHEDFSIPIEDIDLYRNVVWEKKAVFVENAAEDILRQLLPEPANRFAGQIAKMLKVPNSIPAPLIVEDKVIGLLSVQSDDLSEDDIPAITAFAHQMAAAWRKAQLMQDLQSSLEELKQTQAQLLQLQKMEAIGQLTAGIAHDFNNLLTPIGGFAELLLRKASEGSKEHEYLRQIKVAAERAAALTHQLRLFTRQAIGERRSVQLNSLVEETHDLLEHSIPKEIAIELRLEPKLWTVKADPSQISQVLMNLCVNARDAMPKGGTLTLETRNVTLDEAYARMVLEARPGRYVRLSVSDTGFGMSPEVQARLFEPFFTTKEVGEGTGLGLAMVYGIVKGHDGFIQVYSQAGRGSTFHAYLPTIIERVEEGRGAEELGWPTGAETILLVDDEEMVQKLGQQVLELCGYTVLMAEDGVQALEVYQAHQGEIALVVLDVVMPEMDGRECLRRLRELDPQVKVLISTGYTVRGLAEELMAEGALGVVEKPFLLQDFATTVRTTMDR